MQALLSGIRVLDLTRMLAGPYGSQLLADLGAEVIKIEAPGGDPMRHMGPYFARGESAYFLSANRNKKSVVLDLKSDQGRQVFLDLVAVSDVVFENFRPGVMGRLRCDYDTLKTVNPRLIMCSISGYGQTGPRRNQPAFDLVLQALGGGMSVTGEPGQTPVRMGLPIADLAGGMFGALAVAAALHRRNQTGQGAHLDISLLDGQVSLLTYLAQYYLISGQVPQPMGTQHENVVPYNAFATADGYLAVAIFTEKFWAAFCRALEHEEWINDPRFATNEDRRQNRDILNELLAQTFRTRSTAWWMARLQEVGVPAAPVQRVDQVLNDPQVLARKMRITVEHPTIGQLELLGNPIKVDDTPGTFSPPPLLGQHTRQVLSELLGYSPEKIAGLEQTGAIQTAKLGGDESDRGHGNDG
uniref:Formyl-CoA transferase n=1 Tax=uncultured Chloroflexota bacterium TaxID=166587 RepID=H5SN40_9CHLR|nr:formyl-CoA transferase [uncultured Chloroflexota bacterium]